MIGRRVYDRHTTKASLSTRGQYMCLSRQTTFQKWLRFFARLASFSRFPCCDIGQWRFFFLLSFWEFPSSLGNRNVQCGASNRASIACGRKDKGGNERAAWDNEWKRQHQVSERGVSNSEQEFDKEAVHALKMDERNEAEKKEIE